jgi:hypothetical protein
MTDAESDYIADAVETTAEYHSEWGTAYTYDHGSDEYIFRKREPASYSFLL